MLTPSDELWVDASRPTRMLILPPCMKVEFATLEAVWHSTAQTRRVDALVLAWVKYEKQLRRFFSLYSNIQRSAGMRPTK